MVSNQVVNPAINGIQIPVALRRPQMWVLLRYREEFAFDSAGERS